MARRYNLKNIRALLTHGFTEEELRDLCFMEPDFRPVYDELSKSASKNEITRWLIEYAEQKMLLDTLLTLIRVYNPARFEEHKPYYDPIYDVSIWKLYLDRVASEKGKEFPSRERLPGYQDLSSTKGLQLEEEVNNFIQSSTSLMVIEGQAGCGKSVFLQDLARQMAVNLLHELEVSDRNMIGNLRNPVPIFFNLNSFSIKPGESLGREILMRLMRPELLNIPSIDDPENFLRDTGMQWLILLDAFDEVVPQNRSDVWSAIRRLVESYPKVKIVITVRPGELWYKLPESTKITTVALLTEHEVRNYLKVQQIEPVKIKAIFEFLSSEVELWQHLCLPLFLQIAVSYLSGGEVFEGDEFKGSAPAWDHSLSNLTRPVLVAKNNPPIVANIELDQIKVNVHQELINEAELPIELDKLAETVIDEAPIKLGVFLDRIFHRLWKHNEKKRLAGVQLGGLDETYESLGEMAANMAEERRALTIREAKRFVNDGIYWILDLGILLQKKGWVSFYTSLSKAYFAAFYLTILLESNPSELSNLIRGSPNFWEKCLLFVRDITYDTDITPLIQNINTLKGGQTNV